MENFEWRKFRRIVCAVLFLAGMIGVEATPADAQSAAKAKIMDAAAEQGAKFIDAAGDRLINRVVDELFGDADASRSTDVFVHNHTGVELYKTYDAFSSGGFSNGHSIEKISAYSKDGYRVESHGVMSGVTNADIRFGTSPGHNEAFDLRIVTSNPYAGDNSMSVETSAMFKVSKTMATGNNNSVQVHIYDAKPAPVPVEGKTVSLLSAHGKYAVAESDGRMNANRPRIGAWELFTLVENADGTVSLRSHHGKYVVSEQDGTLNANRAEIGDWEKFKLVRHGDGSVSFKTHFGTYLVAEEDGSMNANRAQIGPWEKFQMIE